MNEQSMADMLGVSAEKLHDLVFLGALTFSVYRDDSKEFEFDQESIDDNVRIWNCRQSGQHRLEFDRRNEDGLSIYKCKTCGMEKMDLMEQIRRADEGVKK